MSDSTLSVRYRKFRYQAQSDIADHGYRTKCPPMPVSKTTVHNNAASSSAATNGHRYLTMKGKSADFLKTSVAALEVAELLCTIVLYTGTGTVIPPQAPVPRICIGP